MPSVPFDRFVREVQAAWNFPAKSKATQTKMRQALREFGEAVAPATTTDLTQANVARWANAQLAAGRSPNTVRGLLSYFRAACWFAFDEGWIERVPFSRRRIYVRRSRPSPGPVHPAAAIRAVLDSLAASAAIADPGFAARRIHALANLAAYTGMRRGECLGLTWAEVDLPRSMLRLSPARRLKTAEASSPVPIPAALGSILRDWRGPSGSDWVVPRLDRGGPWTGGVAGTKPLDRLKQAGLAAGVVGFTFASLRRSWATLAESTWGLSGPAIQRVLRHTTLATQEHYRRADEPALAALCRSIGFGESGRTEAA